MDCEATPAAVDNQCSNLNSTPSMRRPVSVNKLVLFFFPEFFGLSCAASVAILPSALFRSDSSLGASWAYSFQQVLLPEKRPRSPFAGELGPGLGRSHLNSAVELDCEILLLTQRPRLRDSAHDLAMVSQWFVHFSADPQPVKQYGQLPGYGNDRSLLGIFASAFCQSQPPAP